MEMCNNHKFSDNIRFMRNKNNVIIINGYTGIWGMLDTRIFTKINYCVENKIEFSEYVNDIEDDKEKIEFKEVIDTLIDEKMLVDSESDKTIISIKEVEFKITNKCNLRCMHCGENSDIHCEDKLDTESMKLILNKIFNLNIETLYLTGGEPLIRKDIKILINYIRANFNGDVKLITNGTLITNDLAKLLKRCVKGVSISVDGYNKESIEFIRGKGVYEKILNAINHLKEVGFGKDNIVLTMTCTSQNIDHIKEFDDFCRKLKVSGGAREFTPVGRGMNNYEELSIKNYVGNNISRTGYEKDLDQIREEMTCKIFCKAGVEKVMINELGYIYPCLSLEYDNYKIGDALSENIGEILNSSQYYEFIKTKLQTNIVDVKEECKDCSVRYFCTNRCLGYNEAIYRNKDILKVKCEQALPFLSKLLWD